jgi:glycosyltransferase involved in cell wall biosynthesis
MRVLHFRKKFSVLSEIYIYDYIVGLERQGVSNHVVTLTRQHADSRPFDKVHVVSGPGRFHPSRVMTYVIGRLRENARDGSSWPVLRRRLRQLTARLSPDVIHAHCGPEAVLIAPVALALRIPLVVTFYGSDISRLPRHESWRTRYAQLWREAAAVTALSQDMRTDAVALGCPPDLLHVVHLGRDLASTPSPTVSHPVRRFISVGRLVEKKGHADAVRALGRIAMNRPDVHLTIIGDGPLRSPLERLVHELRLTGHVSLLGAQPITHTLEQMRRADAFILCSKAADDGDKEGTPAVLLEAQLIGLPCVATRHAGIPETIPLENHRLLATEGSVEEISERLSWLVGSTTATIDAIVTRGRQFVAEQFDLGTQVAHLRTIYESLSPVDHFSAAR